MIEVVAAREIEAPTDAVRDAIRDVEAFTEAGGFTEVAVEGHRISIANAVGLLRIELELAVVDDPDAVLAFEQREGIFREMTTTVAAEPTDGGTLVTARTEFELDVSFVGPIFDATVVKRQRRLELERQLDYVERTANG